MANISGWRAWVAYVFHKFAWDFTDVIVNLLIFGGRHSAAHVTHARLRANSGYFEGPSGVTGHEGVHPQPHPHLLQQRQSGHHPHPAAGVEAEPLEDAADHPVVIAGLAPVVVGAVQRRRPAVKDYPEAWIHRIQGVEQCPVSTT